MSEAAVTMLFGLPAGKLKSVSKAVMVIEDAPFRVLRTTVPDCDRVAGSLEDGVPSNRFDSAPRSVNLNSNRREFRIDVSTVMTPGSRRLRSNGPLSTI